MKLSLYPRIALDGIRRNGRLYLPYLLTGAGIVSIYYILVYLSESRVFTDVDGGSNVRIIMGLGSYVIAFFSLLLLLYSNSFLMRRRRKEFGLYSVLGMGKKHVALVLLWETLFVGLFSVIGGLLIGIVLSKLAELWLLKLVGSTVAFSFSLSALGIGMTLLLFGAIFLLLFFVSLSRIGLTSPIALMRGGQMGEKPPRANWVPALLGVIVLAAAYAMALSVQDAFSAFQLFFIAVLMVIAATYLLMMSGSVLLCRLLQRNRGYYYKPRHFVSVSSMAFRMRRNGAGLASICILSTMVLVTLSTTVSLYFGADDAIRARYPREINTGGYIRLESAAADGLGELQAELGALAADEGVELSNTIFWRRLAFVARVGREELSFDPSAYGSKYQIYLLSLSDYNAATGESRVLQPGEALIYDPQSIVTGSSLQTPAGTLHIAGRLSEPAEGSVSETLPVLQLIVPDFNDRAMSLYEMTDAEHHQLTDFFWTYSFDIGAGEEKQLDFAVCVGELFRELGEEQRYGLTRGWIESRALNRMDYYSIYSSMLCLGIILSIVFTAAAVLIIYYKQISEGYEDQARFDIMQKVGMTRRLIRASINSQLLTVFFLPLAGAGMHLLFAFPMIRLVLQLFQLENVGLFASTCAICFAAFAILYALVYRATSNAYYGIVSGVKKDE